MTENLSGIEITSILEHFLYSSLQPISQHSYIIKRMLADILSQTYKDNRRKISILNKNKLIDNIYTSIVCLDSTIHWNKLKKCNIERSILIKIVTFFNRISQKYLDYEIKAINGDVNCYNKMTKLEKYFGSDRRVLSGIIRISISNTDLYFKFKQLIVEKYIKLAYNESQKSAKMSSSLSIDSEELFKNLLLALDKAIDKYSCEKGALSSYIQWWFKDAKINSEFSHEYGQAMRFSENTRRDITNKKDKGKYFQQTFTSNLDDHEIIAEEDSAEDTLISNRNNAHLINLINSINGFNISKLYLGIVPPQFTDKQKSLIN